MIPLTGQQERAIHQAASEMVAAAVTRRLVRLPDPTLDGAARQTIMGAFVSLKRRGRLRGCCGLFGAPVPKLMAQPAAVAVQPVPIPVAKETSQANFVKNEAVATSSNEVLGATEPAQTVPRSASNVEEALATPRTATNFMYLVLATIVLLGLALTIFIRIDIQHPRLIVNGVLFLILISSVLAFNHYIATATAQVF